MTIESDPQDGERQVSNSTDNNNENAHQQMDSMDGDEESSGDDYLDDEEDFDEDDETENGHQQQQQQPQSQEIIRRTYVPGASSVTTAGDDHTGTMEVDDEDELECDLSAYLMYHKAETGFPCLSFDILEDRFGSSESRVSTFPQTAYLVAGTQADKVQLNKLLILKCSLMNAVRKQKAGSDDDEEDSDNDDEEDDEELPDLQSISIAHNGCVNRIRARKIGDRHVAATFSELGMVHLWDLSPSLEAIDDVAAVARFQKHADKTPPKPVYTFNGHGSEGYALDWSPTTEGSLASGDCSKRIFLWKLADAGWIVDQLPLTGHEDSVEDIQWSPNEPNILASCSADRSIRIWDIRTRNRAAIKVPDAHAADVNVISWNRLEKAFILSGGDDGTIKVWDLRQFRSVNSAAASSSSSSAIRPVATFKHHQAPITSVEWHPTDGTVFAASSDDNQITLWDLAVESDGNGSNAIDDARVPETADDAAVNELPPQLLFIHQGQKEVKELHWHAQLPGVLLSTAITGFDIFRTISV